MNWTFETLGETRRSYLGAASARRPRGKQVGADHHGPSGSLLETVEYGYFDDLLIGEFMKTQLNGMTLYPLFSPCVARLGGNAKVFTAGQLWRFRMRHLARNPTAFLRSRWEITRDVLLLPTARRMARAVGLSDVLKTLRRRMIGAPRAL